MITVRIGYTDLPDIESALVKGGMPPMVERRGVIRRWFDPKSDEWVYEWIPEAEMRSTCTASHSRVLSELSEHTCPTCHKRFRGADDRFCPDCHREAQAHGPLGASA